MRYGRPGPPGTHYNNPMNDPWSSGLNESDSPWPLGTQTISVHRDDITFLVDYIVDEMNTNAHSDFVKGLAELNRFSAKDCIKDFNKLPLQEQLQDLGITPSLCVTKQIPYRALALLLWKEKVKDKAEWDHKPKIKDRFLSSVSPFNDRHLYGDYVYSHEIWSNIHYGYVGMAAGFSESVLIKGAGVAHVASRVKNSKSFEKGLDIIREKLGDDLRTWDDPKDKAAIEVGIRLYRHIPERVTAEDLMDDIWFSRDSLAIRPYDPRFDR